MAVVLIDERRGPACASDMGVPVIGSFGLLVVVRQARALSRLRSLTDALLDSVGV